MVTIRTIAEAAGVSVGTVSHTLNHPERVAAATRERVQQAMEALGWQPNPAAQTLRRPISSAASSRHSRLHKPSFQKDMN